MLIPLSMTPKLLALLMLMVPLSTLLCYISRSSGYQNIYDQHRNPNIIIRDIIWLGNQLGTSDTAIQVINTDSADTIELLLLQCYCCCEFI